MYPSLSLSLSLSLAHTHSFTLYFSLWCDVVFKIMLQTPSKVSPNVFRFHLSIRSLQNSFLMNLSVEAFVLFAFFSPTQFYFPGGIRCQLSLQITLHLAFGLTKKEALPSIGQFTSVFKNSFLPKRLNLFLMKETPFLNLHPSCPGSVAEWYEASANVVTQFACMSLRLVLLLLNHWEIVQMYLTGTGR